MKATFTLIILSGFGLILSPAAYGQAVLNNTTLGQQQNDARDLANSLQPGPQKYGKGEKKLQINSAELKSKSIKDATFGGSLMNIGIDASAPKLDTSKEHTAPSEEPSTRKASNEQAPSTSKQSAATNQEPSTSSQSEPLGGSTFSSLSQTAILADELSQSEVTVAPAPEPNKSSNSSENKDTGPSPAGVKATEEKSATDKTSSAKPDGDH